MFFTNKKIQKATYGELEEMLAELAEVHTTEAAKHTRRIEERMAELGAYE